MYLESLVWNQSGSAWTITEDGGSVAIDAYFGDCFMREVNDLEVPGSGQVLGDQRNIPNSNTSAYGSVRTTTALTATSLGKISINAHTVRYGAVSVAYSAVTNAITGKAQGSSWVVYCRDPGLTGGVKTWYAAANPDAAMNIADDVVVAGQITIPTSGSSSGGGGSGGGDPGDWCVDIDSVLPDGRCVRDLQIGDMVPCWNMDASNPQIEMRPVVAIGFGTEESYRLVTTSLATVTQSRSTPMNLRDGSVVRTTEMFGKEVLVNRDNVLSWELVCDLIRVGDRQVVKLNLGDRVFFAGDRNEATIATHNIAYKP